ncbi:MAG: hypothetical protein VXX85_00600 [Candidatus Margulisiibacteriota bacterium]|nr:hypothetical protein [Candidatus Margulisiibacteriota bacterium]
MMLSKITIGFIRPMANQRRKLRQAFAGQFNSQPHLSTYHYTNAMKELGQLKSKHFYAISKDETGQMKLFKNIVYFLENFETIKFQTISSMNHVAFNKLLYKKIEPNIDELKEWILLNQHLNTSKKLELHNTLVALTVHINSKHF